MSEENEQLYKEAQRRLREITTLYEASQACLSISDQKGLLTATIEAAARAADAALGSVMLVDEEKGEYVFGAHYGLSQETVAAVEAELHIPLGEGLVGTVVTTGQPLVVADVTTDPRWIPMKTKERMRSFLGVPLVGRDGQPLGALTLSRPDVGAFDEGHARLLSAFANQAALAIENARLYKQAQQEIAERKRAIEALQQRTAQLEALRQVGLELTAQLDLDVLLRSIVSQAVELLGGNSGGLYLYRPERDMLEWTVAIGPHLAPTGAVLRRGEGLSGKVWESGEPLIVDDYQHWEGRTTLYEGYPLKAVVGVPVRWGEEFLGVLNVLADSPWTFSQADAELLSLFATRAAIAIRNARLYEQAQQEIVERKRAEEELRESQERFRSIFENAVMGLYRTTPDGRILMANPALVHMLGYSSFKELAQRNLEENGYESEYPRSAFKQRVESEGQVIGLESAWVKRDGTTLFLRESARAIRDEAGNALYYEGTVEDITERKRAEETLRESEERFRQVAELSPFPVSIIDSAGRYEYVNPKFIEVFGYTLEDIPNGKEWFARAYPDPAYRQEVISAWLSDLEQFGEYEVRPRTFSVTCKDETVREVLFRPVTMKDGKQFVIYEDITERKRAEEVLRESELQYRTTIDSMGDVIHVIDNELRFILFNSAFKQWSGELGLEMDVIGRTVFEVFPFLLDRVCDEYHRVFDTGKTLITEESTKVGDKEFITETRKIPIFEAGRIARVVTVIRDITERKQAEEALRRRNRELTELNAIIAIITATLELDQVLQEIVESVARLFPQARGATIQLLDETTGNLLTRAASKDLSDRPGRLTFRHGEGIVGLAMAERRPINVVDVTATPHFIPGPAEPSFRSLLVAPLLFGEYALGTLSLEGNLPMAFGDEDEHLVQLLAKYAAIAVENARLFAAEQQRTAELGRVLEQQQELDRLKSEFIQNVSHELRTPVAIAQGYAGLLDSGELGELQPDQREPMAIIARRLRMLSKMVDNLIAILEAEAQELTPEPVDLVNLVHTLLSDFQIAAEQAGLSLAAEVVSDVPQVSGDPDHLRRVLDNLVHNALKFTPVGGSVTVRLWQDGMNVVLEVTDTGIGIPHDQLGRIFERFYQVNGSTTRRYDGTGLGLALVKEIVEAHGGKVDVESKVGQGSTFKVYLPITSRPVEDTAPK